MSDFLLISFLGPSLLIGSVVVHFCLTNNNYSNESDELRLYYKRRSLEKKKTVNYSLPTTVSAPGKALIAGGYLVLEYPNIGLTISSTSRFFTTIKCITLSSTGDRERNKRKNDGLVILVESPQFHASYTYDFNYKTCALDQVGEKGNDFVEKCLSLVLAFIKQTLGATEFTCLFKSIAENGVLGIKLRADNDFYSQIKELQSRGLPLLSKSLLELPSFFACPRDAQGRVDVAKTGMGSSAALTTSLVGALLQYFGIVRLGSKECGDVVDSEEAAEKEKDRFVVHNLSQLAHAIAQGKIGSGFDVAAAVYGTQMYQRFSADGFTACMEPAVKPDVIFASVMDSTLWGQTTRPFTLPFGLDICMGDVCGGSSSSSMAREVLRWRKENPVEAELVWSELAATNISIFEEMEALSVISRTLKSSADYKKVLEWASTRTADAWQLMINVTDEKLQVFNVNELDILNQLLHLKNHFRKTRKLLKSMGENAGVGIEPESQTLLADATELLPGVFCAGVPGAGGVDAVFAITLSFGARANVEAMWASWGERDAHTQSIKTVVCPLMLCADMGESSGLRGESLDW